MSETKLLPCPFCGGGCIYETFEINSLGAEIPVIFCNHCKIVFKVENDSMYLKDDETYAYLAKKNIEAWNTRKPMERIVERLEEVAEEERQYWYNSGDEEAYVARRAYTHAIKIVKKEGVIC